MTWCTKMECWDIWLSIKTNIELKGRGGEEFMCPQLFENNWKTCQISFQCQEVLATIFSFFFKTSQAQYLLLDIYRETRRAFIPVGKCNVGNLFDFEKQKRS